MEKQNAQMRMDYLLAKDRERQIKQQGYETGDIVRNIVIHKILVYIF